MENQLKKGHFKEKKRILLDAIAKVLSSFKSKIFPIKDLDKIPTSDPRLDPTVFDKPKPLKAQTEKSKIKIA